jgi:glycerol-3-phosphate dehydrogenase
METHDLLVVGGGILGAACAREAALDGRSVVLVEAGDLAGGTSSASSKLVHGGLRYLEHGALGLVREAVLERHDLLRTASHLVEPLDFVLPVTRESRHGALATRAALTMYDALAWPRGIGGHRALDRQEILSRIPGLRSDGVGCGYLYRDARMDDARLCLEVLFDARELGVTILPRTSLVGLRRQDGPDPENTSWLATLESNSEAPSPIRARTVLFCTGVWTDALLEKLGLATPEPLVSPSRGDHLVYPDWGLRQAVILPEPGSDRFFFVIPWQGMTLAGTTEDPWSPADGAPLPLAAERIRGWMRTYFPTLEQLPHAAFSGVRPLAHAPGKPLQQASREHRLTRIAADCHALVGGKYTTFRAIAAQCRSVWRGTGASRSPGRLLPGAWRDEGESRDALDLLASWNIEGSSGWPARYGRRLAMVGASLADCRDAGIPAIHRSAATEIVHAMREEWAGNLVDVAARRTLDAWRPDRGERLVPAMAALVDAGLLDWDATAQARSLREWCGLRTGGAS